MVGCGCGFSVCECQFKERGRLVVVKGGIAVRKGRGEKWAVLISGGAASALRPEEGLCDAGSFI